MRVNYNYDMCGGIAFKLDKISKKELMEFYSKAELAKMEEEKEGKSFFWSKTPVLPVDDGDIHLKKWGNREKDLKLPQTGWVKKESIDDGKWAHLKPKLVEIVADKGYEKGVWFDTKGFKGLLVKKDNEERVYMMTKAASEEYKKMTKHDREPVGLGS